MYTRYYMHVLRAHSRGPASVCVRAPSRRAYYIHFTLTRKCDTRPHGEYDINNYFLLRDSSLMDVGEGNYIYLLLSLVVTVTSAPENFVSIIAIFHCRVKRSAACAPGM